MTTENLDPLTPQASDRTANPPIEHPHSQDSPSIIKHSAAFGHSSPPPTNHEPATPVPEQASTTPPRSLPKLHVLPPLQPTPELPKAAPKTLSASVWPPINQVPSTATVPNANPSSYTPLAPLSAKPVTNKSLIVATAIVAVMMLITYLAFGRSGSASSGDSTNHSKSLPTSVIPKTTNGTPDNPSGSADQNPTSAAGATKQIQGDENYCKSDPLLNC
jgi:hypothetical protein